ncbi:PucR family transcriptional regulator [Streptomyces qinglanensis]|uniref:PucR C-terminal helix-turn-helix domain-containing protein n=1 Tax=Streptomyces qinglanensis TaxID=943816 RepID=A0A1H9SD87_9ACTN|nr:helix-turn-helix domain-containing protein [Streptomyces qinglanensis]SER82980.1 PucR C-terminal helix-turn-helix domain-containing protein [Streptomyces qinglanensis]
MAQALTLHRLVQDIGDPLLRLAVDPGGAKEPVAGVAIHDPADGGGLEPGCLVLCVGMDAGPALLALGSAALRAGARGLAVKGPLPAECAECPVPVVEVNPGASWMHLAATVRQRLLDHSRAQWEPAGATSDLFQLANTISAMIQAPVAIEDAASAVLAWSAGQGDADESRVETILGRAVHPDRLRRLAEQGAFERLRRTTAPVYIEPHEPGMLPRVAMAVRADSEVLGYVWAVVTAPLSPGCLRSLEMFAPVVALHLINNAHADSSGWARRQRRDLAAAVLAGGSAGMGAARELQLDTGALCLVAVGLRPYSAVSDTAAAQAAVAAARLRRLEEVLTLYLTAMHPAAVAVRGDRAVYALATWPRTDPDEALTAARSLAADFVSRSATALGDGWMAAVAGPAAEPGQVPTIRAQADAVLHAMRRSGEATPAVATLDETALQVLLDHLRDITQSLGLPPASGALRRLAAHEGADGYLTETLAAFVAAQCVSEDAAARLRVHPNTLRYRLRRIREVSGLDFQDADQMLLVQLQLRLQRREPTTPFDATDKAPDSNSS